MRTFKTPRNIIRHDFLATVGRYDNPGGWYTVLLIKFVLQTEARHNSLRASIVNLQLSDRHGPISPRKNIATDQ